MLPLRLLYTVLSISERITTMIFYGYLVSISYGIICLAIAALLRKFGMPTLYTRKITHILIGAEWIILYRFFIYNYRALSSFGEIHFLIVCIIFTVLVIAAYVWNLLPQISSASDNSAGTVYYCLAMTLMAIVSVCFMPRMMLPFGVGALCTSLGDGFAGIFGQIKKHNKIIYKKKTLLGTIACFLFSLASVAFISLVYGLEISVPFMLVIAVVSAELELISSRGLDNIFVTVGVALVSFIAAEYPQRLTEYILPLVLTVPIIVLVKRKNALTSGGIAAAVILDILASLAFGNMGFSVLIIFFCTSLLSDKIKAKATSEKKETRNALQVLANGGAGIVISILSMIFSGRLWIAAFCAVFSEALADTVSSGVGRLSKNTVDPLRLRRVESGTSGGISLLGTFSAALSSAFIALAAVLFIGFDAAAFFAIFLGGFIGTLFDSFLGSLLQAKYKCSVCGKSVETNVHCGERAEKISGLSFIDNNAVNFLSTVVSSIVAVVIFLLL